MAQSRRPGRTAREEILDAAGELFTTQGYAGTSTRAVADAVGMRQASLYHHFATKDDILDALLFGTVESALRLAEELVREPGPAAQRLHTLAFGDTHQLCTSRWNLGALYLLPEVRGERHADFHAQRDRLREVYRTLARGVIAECGGPTEADELPFRVVESVISRRSDDGACPPELPWTIADGALRIVGFTGDFDALRRGTSLRLRIADDNVTV